MDDTAQAVTPNSGEELQLPPGRCSSCIRMERIAEGDISRKWEHHKNFAALDESAELGCDVCRLLRWSLLCPPSASAMSFETPPFSWSTLMKSADPVYVYSTVGQDVDIEFSLGDIPPSRLIVTSRNENGAVGHGRVCKFLLGQEARDLNRIIRQARRWIETCHYSHHGCGKRVECYEHSKASIGDLPTRLIDVGTSDGKIEPRLCLSTEIDEPTCVKGPFPATEGSSSYQYLTLSYCWGNPDAAAITTKTNIDARLSGISLQRLPKTIRDAIQITRELNVRFIWIDALCIIQDDMSDWAAESTRMGQYYENALCTIAATGAADSTEGCFFERRSLRFDVKPCVLNLQRRHKRTPVWMAPNPIGWGNAITRASLNKRGWAKQERVLSPRILQWSHVGVFWECNTLAASEEYPEGLFEYEAYDGGSSKFSKYSKLRHFWEHTNEELLCAAWLVIAGQVCAAEFTYVTDRLASIAGLVKKIQERTHDPYYAGMWRSALPQLLSWKCARVTSPRNEEEGDGYPGYIAPSWSWASCIHGQPNWDLLSLCLEFNKPMRYVTEIVFVAVTPIGQDFTGPISHGKLTLRGPLRRTPLTLMSHEDWLPGSIWDSWPSYVVLRTDESAYQRYEDGGRIYFDGEPSFGEVPNTKRPLKTVCLLQHGKYNMGYPYDMKTGALVLSPTGEAANEYTRIGWAELDDSDWFEDADVVTVDIV